jgi:ABC-type multidrug transport system ATPase subunit
MKIRLNHLTKTYPDGRQALKDISLEIPPGLLGLLGPNGAGKTTLLSILAFLLRPASGSIEAGGLQLPRQINQYRRRLGFLPQHFDFPPKAKVSEVLHYFGSLFGLEKETLSNRSDFLLRQVGLYPYRDRRTSDLSVGMKKRLGVAQALINDPALLILDEPTSGLDPEERILFCNYLSEISEDRIIILSTHIVADVEEICSSMALLDSGCLVFHGPPWDFVRRARGKTWRLLQKDHSSGSMPEQVAVVTRQETEEGTLVRFVSPGSPPAEAIPVEPTLEDAYLLHFIEQSKPDAALQGVLS